MTKAGLDESSTRETVDSRGEYVYLAWDGEASLRPAKLIIRLSWDKRTNKKQRFEWLESFQWVSKFN